MHGFFVTAAIVLGTVLAGIVVGELLLYARRRP